MNNINHNRILLFGGTFDPIHNGHLGIAHAVARQIHVGQVVFIPSAHPPHKLKWQLTTAEHRVKMVELAVQGNELFTVSDCELQRSGPSFTLDTIRYFRKQLAPEVSLFWLIGADTIPDLAGWYKIGDIAEECTIVTAARPGFTNPDLQPLEKKLTREQLERIKSHILDTPIFDISATDIRRRLRENQPVEHLLPRAVLEYIRKHNLYTNTRGTAATSL